MILMFIQAATATTTIHPTMLSLARCSVEPGSAEDVGKIVSHFIVLDECNTI